MKWFFLGVCAAALTAYCTFELFDRGVWHFNHPDSKRYPVTGIDVSHHQGVIDWKRVRSNGISFAYIKASEGGDFRDRRFLENWEGARREGIPRGAYHFFTLCKGGEAQAKNFIYAVPKEAQALPPVVDLEFGGNCSNRPSREQLAKELDAFIALVGAHYGKEPMLYITHEFFDAYLKDAGRTEALWIRDIFGEPELPKGRAWVLWQFRDRGQVMGIKGPVDLNVFHGSSKDFASWTHSGHSLL